MQDLPPALFIGKVRLPETSIFENEISTLADEAKPPNLKKSRADSDTLRKIACQYLIEGLYHVFCSMNPDMRLSVPHSQAAYANNPLLKTFTYRTMKQAVDTLVRLGWAIRYAGYSKDNGRNVLTTLRPRGYLLDIFSNHGLCWQRLAYRHNEKTIFLREKRTVKKKVDGKLKTVAEVITIPTPNTAQVRLIRDNLKRINDHISSQAICLHMTNHALNSLSKEIASKNNPTISFFGEPKKKGRHVNFYDVLLYRVFSGGSMQLGGRFYGGWWQIIPSQFRPFITINGLATYEVDYSEFHPRLLYAICEEKPPSGDLYDFGYRLPGHPKWDPSVAPYNTVRAIHKKFFNAYLNDPKGKYRLEFDDKQMIGLNETQLREQMLFRHPLLLDNQGVGLQLQFLDSQIAEFVILDLLKDGITCLPVHDSFIVDRRFVSKLQDAMNRGYQSFVPGIPKLKLDNPEQFSGFQVPIIDGKLDKATMLLIHESAIHNIYLQSWLTRTGRW